jgi:protein-disulfide isomerase
MEYNEETITLKKSSLWKFATFLFAGLFIVSLFTGGFGLSDNSGSAVKVVQPSDSGNKPSVPTPSPINVNAEDLVDDNDPVLGDKDAPVTIVEFSDFQCPFCARFRTQTFEQIKTEYIDTGKVKFVYKDFPLDSIHSNARSAAEAAECANEQGKFWEYHDLLFEKQREWASATGNDLFKQYAADLRLDTEKFNDCIDSKKYASEVSDDLKAATSAGGRGTPYFIVGSTPVSGARPFSAFQEAIEAELSK